MTKRGMVYLFDRDSKSKRRGLRKERGKESESKSEIKNLSEIKK